MGDQSAIEWTDATWNPIRGCSRVSEGCRNCYAEREAVRHTKVRASPNYNRQGPYYGLVKSTPAGPRWTGEVRFVEEALDLPLRWKRPRRIFVNSMSDLFHEQVPDAWRDRIFSVMERAAHHTYQILTKRPEIMRRYATESLWKPPLRHIWLGVSVEDQATADERIPLLLQTPARVRWVSYEPALGPVDFSRYFGALVQFEEDGRSRILRRLDWIVIGGESGPGARPFDLAWARDVVAPCRLHCMPVFVKQLGARAFDSDLTASGRSETIVLRDRKGGDIHEWPSDLRVREFPHA